MTNLVKIILKPGKEAPLRRFHPWIFSGAILNLEGIPKEGDVVEVLSNRREYLATGHYFTGNIAVKVFSFSQTSATMPFWKSKLSAAFELRKQLGFTEDPTNTAYRLVNSEGDGLPGLIIDYYDGCLVLQTDSMGMSMVKPMLVEALKEIYGEKLKSVFDKSAESVEKTVIISQDGIRSERLTTPSVNFLYGTSGPVSIRETGHEFMVDFIRGQKTGFFLDQRGNRMFAQYYGRNRKVLNAFCYSGAFSVYALKGGATSVHSVDSSQQAIGWTKENMKLNAIPDKMHTEEVADLKRFLTQTGESYDMIILDPPAFAKHHNVSHNALQAYIYINGQAMKRLNAGGILFTFSCSQAINREMFRSAIQAAAIETGKQVKILHQLSQGPDHPISIFHPEGEYLKGLILSVE
ncbi:MAG: class I SAM-dependent rRNA methyltransferase [Bacteroidota bacterium]